MMSLNHEESCRDKQQQCVKKCRIYIVYSETFTFKTLHKLCCGGDYEIKAVERRLWENGAIKSSKLVKFIKIYFNDKIEGVKSGK
jgi:hypothetical protein